MIQKKDVVIDKNAQVHEWLSFLGYKELLEQFQNLDIQHLSQKHPD